mmetsp:Transcript_15781/g.39068  ORF Transcript_15781/g.39068 Transcript_15781/m.39068 type:complete len:208 (+) Transcript_15781:749-1372(+)
MLRARSRNHVDRAVWHYRGFLRHTAISARAGHVRGLGKGDVSEGQGAVLQARGGEERGVQLPDVFGVAFVLRSVRPERVDDRAPPEPDRGQRGPGAGGAGRGPKYRVPQGGPAAARHVLVRLRERRGDPNRDAQAVPAAPRESGGAGAPPKLLRKKQHRAGRNNHGPQLQPKSKRTVPPSPSRLRFSINLLPHTFLFVLSLRRIFPQ